MDLLQAANFCKDHFCITIEICLRSCKLFSSQVNAPVQVSTIPQMDCSVSQQGCQLTVG